MAIQDSEILWGEMREYPVVSVFAKHLWPNASVFRMAKTASIDFVVAANNEVVAYVEVKVRRVRLSQYPTTVVHKDKHLAGRFNLKFHGVHTYAAVLFEDNFGWFDLATSPDEELTLSRYGVDVPHVGYKIERMQSSTLLFAQMQERIAQLVAGGAS